MKFFSFIFLLVSSFSGLLANPTVSGTLKPEQLAKFRAYNDSLKVYNDSLVNAMAETERTGAAMKIIKTFSRVLREEGAYQYTFDSLTSIAVVTPEDNKFRIFTWQVAFDNGTYRYFGVIQSNETKPKLQPLVDYGSLYEHPDSIIVDADRWIGALYYRIIPAKVGKKTYYTLFGWDANNVRTNKKLIDILWFDEDGKAKLGYPLFDMDKEKSPCRVILEYKKDATLSLSYYPEEKQIYYDHLVSLSGSTDPIAIDKVPDGTLEGFKWEKGKWRKINLIEYQRRENGDVPNVIKEQTKRLYQPLPPR